MKRTAEPGRETSITALEFDYVVIGAGSAGCAIAARLAEYSDGSVALIEGA